MVKSPQWTPRHAGQHDWNTPEEPAAHYARKKNHPGTQPHQRPSLWSKNDRRGIVNGLQLNNNAATATATHTKNKTITTVRRDAHPYQRRLSKQVDPAPDAATNGGDNR